VLKNWPEPLADHVTVPVGFEPWLWTRAVQVVVEPTDTEA